MADAVFFTSTWAGAESGERDLTVAFFKVVGGESHLCFSETKKAVVEAGESTWADSFRLLDIPWGSGSYVVRLFVGRDAVAEGTLQLAYD